MDLFTYLMAKNGQNTQRDLFSYLLGKKASGGSGTYTTFSGTSLNISNTIKAAIKKFMLNSTELTQDGTPSPDNPVDVNVIKGENNIKITDGIEEQNYPITLSSKNLAYTGWAKDFVSRVGDSRKAEILNYDNRNCLKFSADAGYQDYDNKYMFKITCKENTQYTFAFNLLAVTGYFNLYIEYTDGTGTFINGSQSANQWRSVAWSSEANKTIKYLRVRNISGLSYIDLDTFMVLEGVYTSETIPDYTPYYNIEYCKIGDYADQIFKNTTNSPYYDSTLLENEWYLKKNIGKVTFDGSDDEVYEKMYGSIYNNRCMFYLKNIPHNNSNYNLMKSNRFVATAGASEYYPEGINVSYSNSQFVLNLIADNLTEYSNNALKTFFQNNNTTVYYVLETPTYTHISQTDYPTLKGQLDNLYNNAQSYNGTTNITQINDDLSFNISVNVKVS